MDDPYHNYHTSWVRARSNYLAVGIERTKKATGMTLDVSKKKKKREDNPDWSVTLNTLFNFSKS